MTYQPTSNDSSVLQIGVAIRQTFNVIFSDPVRFFGAAVPAIVPGLVAVLLGVNMMTGGMGLAQIIINVAGVVVGFLIQAVITYGTVARLRGNAFNVPEALSYCLGRIGALCGVSILLAVVVYIGVMLFIAPGLFALAVWFVAVPVCVVEQLGIIDSFKRSADLTRGNRWRILGLAVLIALLMVIPFLIVIALAASMTPGEAGFFLISAPISIIISTISSALGAVVYFQLRMGKEGASLDQISSVFG